MVDALSAARPGIVGKTGPSAPLSHTLQPGQGPTAFKSRVTPSFGGYPGPKPNVGNDRILRFVPPLALFNDATQWVNRKFFARAMPIGQNPDSNPLLAAQYFTPPPVNAPNLAAGNLNLQAQYGNIANQAAQLTVQASNYFGG